MKKGIQIFLIAAALIPTTIAWGGNGGERMKGKHRKVMEDAEFYLLAKDYWLASEMFTELYRHYPEHLEINYNLAISLFNLRNEEISAKPYFLYALENGIVESMYYLAKIYHLEEDFDDALKMMKDYKIHPSRQHTMAQVNREIEMIERAKEMEENPVKVQIKNIGPTVNSEYQEYVPLVSADGNSLFFTSRRPEGVGGILDPNEDYYEDVYCSVRHDKQWLNPSTIPGSVNTIEHDANVGFSASGNYLIIYRDNPKQRGGDLFLSAFNGESWDEPMRFSKRINSEYHEPSAAFSPDENIIYLVSDRPGGYGGKDIYEVRKLPNGEWAEPFNLGPAVNSPYDEDAPFVHPNGNTLYFSSNGHNTMGGFDIFKTQITENSKWTYPQNLGYPINSVRDDIYFSLTADGKWGYFSSYKDDGYGGQDIYEVNLLNEEEDQVILKGQIINVASGNPLAAHIELYDAETGLEIGGTVSNIKSGKYVLPLMPDKTYRLKVNCHEFQSLEEEIQISTKEKGEFKVLEKNIQLNPIQ